MNEKRPIKGQVLNYSPKTDGLMVNGSWYNPTDKLKKEMNLSNLNNKHIEMQVVGDNLIVDIKEITPNTAQSEPTSAQNSLPPKQEYDNGITLSRQRKYLTECVKLAAAENNSNNLANEKDLENRTKYYYNFFIRMDKDLVKQ